MRSVNNHIYQLVLENSKGLITFCDLYIKYRGITVETDKTR